MLLLHGNQKVVLNSVLMLSLVLRQLLKLQELVQSVVSQLLDRLLESAELRERPGTTVGYPRATSRGRRVRTGQTAWPTIEVHAW